jgi:hypothetical protein
MYRLGCLCTAILLFHAVAAVAQDANSACPANVHSTNDSGLQRIHIFSPCRRNERVRASYGTHEQEAVFDQEGNADLAVAITDDRSAINLSYSSGPGEPVQTDPAGLATVYRITLQWDEPVDLNLHVVEPSGVVGGKGDATAGNSAAGLIGKIDLEDNGSGPGPFQESYVLPNRLERPSDILKVYVENVTRTREPFGPFCGQGEHAKIAVTLVVADRGRVRKLPFILPAMPCGDKLDDRSYYTRLPF